MKKEDLKNFMIVCNRLDEMFILLEGEIGEWVIIRDLGENERELCNTKIDDNDDTNSLRSFDSLEFNDDLTHVSSRFCDIIKVYDVLPIESEFKLCVKELYEQYNPKMLWEGEPSLFDNLFDKWDDFKDADEAVEYMVNMLF